MRKRGAAAGLAAVFLLVFALLAGVTTVYADGVKLHGNVGNVRYVMQGGSEPELSGKVEFLRQEDDRYVMQVTVANAGADFSGTVRLVFASSYSDGCAYDTELTLPKDGQKQFTLTIPMNSADTTRGSCAMSFLNEKGRVLQTISQKNVFGSAKSGVGLGILSDHYDDLTYLDLGGVDFDIRRERAPITLVELSADNLDANLDGLYFLVIDRFDVASLGAEKIRHIQDWVRGGGWLLVGTGEYGEQTLGGFDEDFLGLYAAKISAPGEDNYLTGMEMSGAFAYYQYTGIELRNMAVTETEYLQADGNSVMYEQSWEQPCMTAPIGDGAVSVYAVSLGDPELKKGYSSLCIDMLDQTMTRARSYSSFYDRSDIDYLGRNALARIDYENTNVDFTWLKVLIAVYVVMAGPVLYLILRKCKKSEWYWVGVPLLGVAFIVLVFFSGKGIRLTETRVYSVSVQRVDGTWQDTYYDAYHSGTKPWKLRLADGYEVGGTSFSSYAGYYQTGKAGDYHYLVRKDSGGMSIGMKPTGNFESGYLYAGGRTERAGEFVGKGLAVSGSGQSLSAEGTVTNRTDEDLAYLAVATINGEVMIFSDVRAGETLDLAAELGTPRCVYYTYGKDYHSLYYDLNGSVRGGGFRQGEEPPADEMMALFLGLGLTANSTDWSTQPVTANGYGAADGYGTTSGTARIVGLTREASATVADRCEEKAYRCLYAYADMEVNTYTGWEVDEYVAD